MNGGGSPYILATRQNSNMARFSVRPLSFVYHNTCLQAMCHTVPPSFVWCLAGCSGPAWPQSRGFGLAWGGFGLLNPQARPKPSTTAWLRLGLAWAAAFVCNNEKSLPTTSLHIPSAKPHPVHSLPHALSVLVSRTTSLHVPCPARVLVTSHPTSHPAHADLPTQP